MPIPFYDVNSHEAVDLVPSKCFRLLQRFVPMKAIMRSFYVGGLFALVSLLIGLSPVSAGAATTPQRLEPGSYPLVASGSYRLLTVSAGKKVLYDVWQVMADGRVTHSHFALTGSIAPPVESDAFLVSRGKKRCGTASLRLYRSGDHIFKGIIVFGFEGVEEPLGGKIANVRVFELSHEIAKLNEESRAPGFYASLEPRTRSFLMHDVPEC
jgi:hypothetical protein